MLKNRYLDISQIFIDQPHQFTNKLITKLFCMLCVFKCELSDDLFVYVVNIMLQTVQGKNVYSFYSQDETFIKISKLSYNFELILEKYFDDNIIGTQIINYMSTYSRYDGEIFTYFMSDNYEAIWVDCDEFGELDEETMPIVVALWDDHKMQIIVCITGNDKTSQIKRDDINNNIVNGIIAKASRVKYIEYAPGLCRNQKRLLQLVKEGNLLCRINQFSRYK